VVVIDRQFFFSRSRETLQSHNVQGTLARRSANRANYQSIASIARAQLIRSEDRYQS